MALSEAIVTYGTCAVVQYRHIAGISQDNEMPELFLGGIIARGVHEELGLHAHIERSYMTIARELQINNGDLEREFGGWRADVAIYDKQQPKAIIELKVVDERNKPDCIVVDRDKVRKFISIIDI